MGNLGNAYAELGKVHRAIEYYEQALAIAREIGDKRGEGADLGNLGQSTPLWARSDKATLYFEQRSDPSPRDRRQKGRGNCLLESGSCL